MDVTGADKYDDAITVGTGGMMKISLLAILFLLQVLRVPPLEQVLASVGRNVKDFQDLLPDFVCDEKITSTAYESGKIRKIKIVNSIFTAVQMPSDSPGTGRLSFTENREITTIDRRAVRKGTKMPRLPVGMLGGFSSLLSMTFSPKMLDVHTYKVEQELDQNGRLVVHFRTRENQPSLRSILNGEYLIDNDTGTAWIDVQEMQVVRLQRDFLRLPNHLKWLRDSVDYGPVTINGREFWLPHTMRSDAGEWDVKDTSTFLAEYTNCKKFVADIKIVPQ
jgi:hypothetical protein